MRRGTVPSTPFSEAEEELSEEMKVYTAGEMESYVKDHPGYQEQCYDITVTPEPDSEE